MRSVFFVEATASSLNVAQSKQRGEYAEGSILASTTFQTINTPALGLPYEALPLANEISLRLPCIGNHYGPLDHTGLSTNLR